MSGQLVVVGAVLTGVQSTSTQAPCALGVHTCSTYLAQPPTGARLGGVTCTVAAVSVMVGSRTSTMGALQGCRSSRGGPLRAGGGSHFRQASPAAAAPKLQHAGAAQQAKPAANLRPVVRLEGVLVADQAGDGALLRHGLRMAAADEEKQLCCCRIAWSGELSGSAAGQRCRAALCGWCAVHAWRDQQEPQLQSQHRGLPPHPPPPCSRCWESSW